MKVFRLVSLLVLIMVAFSIHAQDDQLQEDDSVYVTAVAWSSDGSKIAAVGIQPPGTQGYIHIIDVYTGETTYKLEPIPGGFASVAWSPNNRFIAAGGYDQVVWIIDVETGTHVISLWGHESTVSSLDWNTDGTRLVSGGNWDGKVILWDMTTYEQLKAVQVSDPWGVAFSPDGQEIAVGGLAGLFVFPPALEMGAGLGQNEYRRAEAYIGAIAWSHDGSQIAYGTQTFNAQSASIKLVDSNNGTLLNSFLTDDEAIYSIDWSYDDSLIASYSSDGFIRLWDVRTGTQLQSFAAPMRYPEDINFSPYGGRLAYGGVIASDTLGLSTNSIEVDGNITSFAGGAVQIVVPAPSIERLEAIADACNAPIAVEQALTASIQTEQLADVVAQVEALPDDTIPPACAADLIAVAEALQSR